MGERTYDCSPVIDADGTLLGRTRMVHITDYPCFHEEGYYAPGRPRRPGVRNEPSARWGWRSATTVTTPSTCGRWPLAGAQVVFVPQAGAVDEWPEGLYEAEMRVAAFQNGYYTALCNRVGEEECLTFAGESFVCDPGGRVVGRAPALEEAILYTDLDLNEVDTSHARELFLRDRRPELYAQWLAKRSS